MPASMIAESGSRPNEAILRMILAGTGRELKMAAQGRSMGRMFREGSTICVRGCKNDYRIGDIVVFRTEAGWVVHRVVRIITTEQGAAILTKGDNNRLPDEAVRVGGDALLGKVVAACGGSGQVDFLGRWNRSIGILTATLSYAEGRANEHLVRNTWSLKWVAAAATSWVARRAIFWGQKLLMRAQGDAGRRK